MILELDLSSHGAYFAILNGSGPGAVIYELLEQLPFPVLLTSMFIFIAFLAYVTAADSNTEAISSLCIESNTTHEREALKVKSYLKILWGTVIALIAWFMTAFSGIDGIKMMSNLGGLPALFVVIMMTASLLVWIVESYSPNRNKLNSGPVIDESRNC
jgi:choline-glycine betaine transporter